MSASTVRIRAILQKEWIDLRRNRTVLGAFFALPTLMTVISSLTLVSAAKAMAGAPHKALTAEELAKIPPYLLRLSANPADAPLVMIAYTALMMFSIVPVILPSIMAAHSIVGEKLARSLEPLLATPIRTWELLVGKLIAIVVPALVPSLLGYGVYIVVASQVPTRVVFDLVTSAPFVLSIVLVGPFTAVLAVVFGIMVSARSADLQSAQGLSGMIVLPVIGIGTAQMFGAVAVTVGATLVKALVLLVLDVGGLLLCISVFERETILSRWK